jgi:beta-barrel assembly-enhancing protease
MVQAGYDPRSMGKVMQILGQQRQGQVPPEFLATHPNPDHRLEQIQAVIDKEFPQGVPTGLKP